jgi:hypothetical protein
MNKIGVYFTIIFGVLIVFSSCQKDPPAISTTPSITFVSVAPTSVTQFKDNINFTISYQDGDGDLGQNDPNVYNLFLTDNRINITYPYRIQQLAPDNSNIAIEGNLNIVLPNAGITDGSTSQTATYSIYIVDRAGHQSNTVTSLGITIHQ